MSDDEIKETLKKILAPLENFVFCLWSEEINELWVKGKTSSCMAHLAVMLYEIAVILVEKNSAALLGMEKRKKHPAYKHIDELNNKLLELIMVIEKGNDVARSIS